MNLRRISLPCAIAGVLIIVAAWIPLIRVIFTSPQYPIESPQLRIYAWKIEGKTHEFQILSHYVGIRFPPEVPELKTHFVPWIIVGLGLLSLAAAALPLLYRRIAVLVILLSFAGLIALGQYRMHQSGHDLNPEAPMRMAVKPFTPPIFGWMDVRRIRIWHLPDYGSILIFAALVGLGIGWRRRREASPPAEQPVEAPAAVKQPESL